LDAEKNKERKQQSAAVKSATTQIAAVAQMSPTNRNNKSQRPIVREVNKNLGTNISHKTLSRMVLEGKIGILPSSKPGPVGAFSKVVYQSLKVAFMLYIKLK